MSLKYVSADGTPVDYVMIEGEDVEEATAIAAKWAEKNVPRPFDRIETHTGGTIAPNQAEDDTLDGIRIWHLPF